MNNLSIYLKKIYLKKKEFRLRSQLSGGYIYCAGPGELATWPFGSLSLRLTTPRQPELHAQSAAVWSSSCASRPRRAMPPPRLAETLHTPDLSPTPPPLPDCCNGAEGGSRRERLISTRNSRVASLVLEWPSLRAWWAVPAGGGGGGDAGGDGAKSAREVLLTLLHGLLRRSGGGAAHGGGEHSP